MSANDFIGKTVYDQASNNIGDVNDLILSQDGQIQAVILGVGGFLGIGEKDVAVNARAVQIVQDGDNKRLVVQATKEALNAAPAYDRMNRRYATDANAPATTDQTGSTTPPAGTSGAIDCSLAANASDPACVNKTQQ
jgi:sporulation protein YlmC with PRC-barrel domain